MKKYITEWNSVNRGEASPSQSHKFHQDGSSHSCWGSLKYSDTSWVLWQMWSDVKTRAKQASLILILLTSLLFTFLMTNVHFTQASEGELLLPSLALSITEVTSNSDIMDPMHVASLCPIENHNSPEGHEFVPTYFKWLCSKSIKQCSYRFLIANAYPQGII